MQLSWIMWKHHYNKVRNVPADTYTASIPCHSHGLIKAYWALDQKSFVQFPVRTKLLSLIMPISFRSDRAGPPKELSSHVDSNRVIKRCHHCHHHFQSWSIHVWRPAPIVANPLSHSSTLSTFYGVSAPASRCSRFLFEIGFPFWQTQFEHSPGRYA